MVSHLDPVYCLASLINESGNFTSATQNTGNTESFSVHRKRKQSYVGNLFFALKLTPSYTPCGKAAWQTFWSTNWGVWIQEAAVLLQDKVWAAVPHALGVASPRRLLSPSAFSCLLPWTAPDDTCLLAWQISPTLHEQFELLWPSRMAGRAGPWTSAGAGETAAVWGTAGEALQEPMGMGTCYSALFVPTNTSLKLT